MPPASGVGQPLEQLVDHGRARRRRRERLRESGRPATDDGPAPPVDDEEVARTLAAAQKHGLEAVAFDD